MAIRLSESPPRVANHFETKRLVDNFSAPAVTSIKCGEFFSLKQSIKSGWCKLKLFNANKVHSFSNHNREAKHAKSPKSATKHVMFADRLGLDLEMIHTKSILTDSIPNYHRLDQQSSANPPAKQKQTVKIIVPKFTLCPDTNYRKLIKNAICLNSVEIYNETSIRGIVLTLTKAELPPASTVVAPPASFSPEKLNLNLDLVYVIWSIDDWMSWKYQAAIQNNCKASSNSEIIKTHEFFIQNLDDLLQMTQRLKLIVCHQMGLVVFKDTNNDKCFSFDCAIKI